jgi:GT2 family glycosyltransferase
MSVSIIIPVHRFDANFKSCIASVRSCEPAPEEIIIVLDGLEENDGAFEGVENLSLIRLNRRGGPARARNKGALAARGIILLFLDSDIVVPEEICQQVEEHFVRDGKIDAVFGSYDARPAADGLVSRYKNLLHHFIHQNSSAQAFTFWTGCGAVRRDVFFEKGGFDEQFTQASIEDIELGYRLVAGGATIILDRSIQVRHLKKWRFGEMIHTDFFLRAIPWSRLIFQYGAINNDMNIGWQSRFSVITCVLLVVAFFAAFLNALFVLPMAALGFLFLFLNWSFFRFLYRQGGVSFLLGSLPLHVLYYLIGAVAFGLVSVRQSGQVLKRRILRSVS